MVFVSVIVCTVNRYNQLKKCLRSLNNQSFGNFEVIVVCKEMVESLKKIQEQCGGKFVKQNRTGMCNARNFGIRRSNGEIVAFIDDDAVANERWLEKIVKTFEKDPRIAGVGGKVYSPLTEKQHRVSLVLPKTVFRKIIWDYLRHKLTGDFDEGRKIREVKAFWGCNMAFRKEILEKVGGFDENFYGISAAEEYDVCFRVRKLGYKLVCNPQIKVDHFGESRLRVPRDFYCFTDNYMYHIVKNEVLKFPLDYLIDLLRLTILTIIYDAQNPTDRFLAFLNILLGAIAGYKRGIAARES